VGGGVGWGGGLALSRAQFWAGTWSSQSFRAADLTGIAAIRSIRRSTCAHRIFPSYLSVLSPSRFPVRPSHFITPTDRGCLALQVKLPSPNPPLTQQLTRMNFYQGFKQCATKVCWSA
jgi:hypothetical protein